MGVRSRMTMRATIERDSASTDAYGQPGPPNWGTLAADVACFCWHGTGRTRIGNALTVTTDGPGMVLPKGTDVTAADRIGSVVNRLGTQLFGRMYVDAVLRRSDHVELRLREHA